MVSAFHGSIDIPYAIFLGIGSIAGAVGGTALLGQISNVWLARIFSVVLLVTAARLFIDVPSESGELTLNVQKAILLVFIGVLIGAIAGLLGVGCGIVLATVLIIFFGAAAPIAKGTSLLVAVIAGTAGSWRNYRAGNVGIPVAMRIGIAGIPTALIGSQLAIVMSMQVSMILFAILLVLSAIQLLRSAR